MNQWPKLNLTQDYSSNSFSKLSIILICLAAIYSSLLLFLPVTVLLALTLLVIFAISLLIKVEYGIYLVIFSLPFISPFVIGSQELPFNQTDIFVFASIFCCLFRILIKEQKVDLRTPLDKWFVVLFILYLFAGITSISHNGYLGFIKYIEMVSTFYLIVYLVRSKATTLSKLIRVLIITALIQATWGIIQSLTGSFGATWIDNRGILGYLGLGSTLVWHGEAGFGHFNTLGGYLCASTLFYIPLRHFLIKNKLVGNIILFVLLFGIFTTYSRNSLFSLIILSLAFLFYTTKNRLKVLLISILIAAPLYFSYNILKDTSYVDTINDRQAVWDVSAAAITESKKTLFFGSGLKSVEDAIFRYLPGNEPIERRMFWQSHSFYLFNIIEVGIVGTAIIILFLICNIYLLTRNLEKKSIFLKSIHLSCSLFLLLIFIHGIYDLTFNQFPFWEYTYIMLGIAHAKNYRLPQQAYQKQVC